MEMLNLLPNIASKSDTTERISIRYIPYNVRPQKTVYRYEPTKISQMQENDRRARQNCRGSGANSRHNAFRSNASSNRSSGVAVGNNDRNVVYQNQRARSSLYGAPRLYYSHHQIHGPHVGFPYAYNRFPFGYAHGAYAIQNRMTLMQQNVYQNMLVAFENHGNAIQQTRSLTIQMHNYPLPIMALYRMRHPFIENHYRQSYQNVPWQQRFCQRRPENALAMHNNMYSFANRHKDARRNVANEIVNRPSFTTRSGVSSWTELKKKWYEEKTITIDDEECKNVNENGEEVQVVEQLVNPLVGPRYATSLSEVYSKLAIIKSAPEKTVRRKKSRYKISYNVYSCSHHYRKTNPGQPLYSVVVIRYNLLMIISEHTFPRTTVKYVLNIAHICFFFIYIYISQIKLKYYKKTKYYI